MFETPAEDAGIEMLEDLKRDQQRSNDESDKYQIHEYALLCAERFPFQREPDADEKNG